MEKLIRLRRTSQLTANTTLLESTKGRLVGDEVVAVDPDGSTIVSIFLSRQNEKNRNLPSLEGVGDTDGGVKVLGVESGSEAV